MDYKIPGLVPLEISDSQSRSVYAIVKLVALDSKYLDIKN